MIPILFFFFFLNSFILKNFLKPTFRRFFEFNDADQRCAVDTIDYWIDSVSQQGLKSNVAPERIPWVALRTLLGQTVYGGKIDNEYDSKLLQSFLDYLFTERAFDAEFPLVRQTRPDQPPLLIPDGKKKKKKKKKIFS